MNRTKGTSTVNFARWNFLICLVCLGIGVVLTALLFPVGPNENQWLIIYSNQGYLAAGDFRDADIGDFFGGVDWETNVATFAPSDIESIEVIQYPRLAGVGYSKVIATDDTVYGTYLYPEKRQMEFAGKRVHYQIDWTQGVLSKSGADAVIKYPAQLIPWKVNIINGAVALIFWLTIMLIVYALLYAVSHSWRFAISDYLKTYVFK